MISVGSIVGGGVRLVREQPRTVAVWAGLYALGSFATMLAMRPFAAAMAAMQQQMAARTAAGVATPPVLPPGFLGWLFVFEIVFAVLAIVAFAAVVRATARPGGDRLAYLRLGGDELRLAGLGLALLLAAFVAEIVAVIALILVGALAGLVLGKATGVAVAAVLGIALLGAAIWAEVRLSLAGAFTVLRGRIVVREAWRATRGRFWALLGAYLLLALVWMVVTLALTAIVSPGLLSAYASLDRGAMNAAAADQMARQAAGLSPALIVQWLLGAAVGTVAGAVTCGAVATAAIELGADPLLPPEA